MNHTLTSLKMTGGILAGSATANIGRAPARRASKSVPRTEFDPTRPDVIENPHAHMIRLREHPVQVNERLNVWMIARHKDVLAGVRAPEALSSANGVLLRPLKIASVVTTDNPDHDRLRRMIAPAFSPKAIRAMEQRLQELVQPGIDAIASGKPVDAVRELTAPLPVSAIAELLGVDKGRWTDFREWSHDLAVLFGARSMPQMASLLARSLPGMTGLRKLVIDHLESPDPPGDDVLGLLRKAIDAGATNEIEAVTQAIMVLFAGNETTTNLLGIMLIKLATDPELFQRLRENRQLIPAAIEEALRWGSPIQWVARTALTPYSVGSVEIPARARVMLFYVSANRDPERYTSPETFDVERKGNHHLGFGHGTHVCIGAALARLEMTVALNALFDRIKRLECAGPWEWTRSASLSGPVRLPLRGVPA